MFERFTVGLNNTEISSFFISMVLRNIALSAIIIFSGALLYDLGASIPLIFAFFLANHAVDFFLVVPTAWLGSRIGFKHLIVISQVPLIISVLLLSMIESTGLWIVWIGALLGLASSLYWTSHHALLAHAADEGSRGQEVGLIFIGSRIAAVIGPLLGGLLIALFGFGFSFLMSALVLLASGLFLLRTPDPRLSEPLSITHLTDGVRTKDYLASIGFGSNIGANESVWPLLLYTSIVGTVGLGAIFSGGMFLSLIAAFFATALIEGRERFALVVSALFTSVSWLVRITLRIPLLFLSEPLYAVSQPFGTVSFFSKTYEQTHRSAVRMIAVRRLGMLSGRMLIIGLPILTGGLLWPSLALAALLALLPPLLTL